MLFLEELWKARAESHAWPVRSLRGYCSSGEQLPQSDFLTLRILSYFAGARPRKRVPRSPQLRHVGSKKWHRAVCGRCGLAMRRVEKQVGEVALLRLIPGVSWAQVVKKIPTTDTVFSAQSKHSSHRKSECQGKQTEYSSVPGRAPQPQKRLLLAPQW